MMRTWLLRRTPLLRQGAHRRHATDRLGDVTLDRAIASRRISLPSDLALAVDLTHHQIERAEDGRHIGQQHVFAERTDH
jgi:hypothetical protein